MSLIIGEDTQPSRVQLFDPIVYDDIDDPQVTKAQEIFWDRQEAEKRDRLSPGVEHPDDFVPCDIDEERAIGLVYPTAINYKKECSAREIQLVAMQWKMTLTRCKTKTRWKIVNQRYCDRIKNDMTLRPVLTHVLADKELFKRLDSLPEEREVDDNSPAQDEGLMERPLVNWKVDTISFATKERIDYKDPSLSLVQGQVKLNYHRQLKVKDRIWRNGPQFQYLDRTFPTVQFVGTIGFILAYNINRTVVRIDLYHWKKTKSTLFKTWYIENIKEHSFLQCTTSESGNIIALGNELCVYAWHIDSKCPDQYVWPVDDDENRPMLVTALTVNDANELTIGTVNGHVHRIDLVHRTSLIKTMIADSVAILAIVRRGSKTIAQTINSIYIVECGLGDDKLVEVPTIKRPMCLAVRGTKILCLGKYGMTRLYSSTQRAMFIEIDVPKDFRVEVMYTIPWYKGIAIGKGSRSFHMLLPDGQIRDILSTVKLPIASQ